MARNTIARIDVGAIRHNLKQVRSLAPDSRIMAVVKADAYGHRLKRCLPALLDADLLAVATLDEARAVRALARRAPVVLLEGVADRADLEAAVAMGLELVVHHESQFELLEKSALQPGPRVWLKLDSGMHRLGFDAAAGSRLRHRLHAMAGVEDVVLMTHFACADDAGSALNARQMERFDRAVAGLPGPFSLANSAAILRMPESHRDWVRAGIILYGISPLAGTSGAELELKPAMTLTTELIAVNPVARGESIGYGGRFVAADDMLVGVAAIGYGDGYPRNMPDATPVLVNGHRQRLAGRVSMDMITIDLSDQPGARVGDPVVLWGEGLPVEEIAAHAGTIPYELVCRVTRRVRFETLGE